MERVELDSDGDGDLDDITRYEYNDDGIRVLSEKIDPVDEATVLERTVYHIDPNNHTGYAQVLEEGIDGDDDKRLDANEVDKSYAIGHDVISQATTVAVHLLLADGHGSTKEITDMAAAIVQRFAYDAYGNMLDGVGLTDADGALTSLLFSGEQTDPTGLQYLRARYYDPASGRFNRLDPFAGNLNDPLSLHKYLYTHGDPVNNIDPTGMFSLGGLSVSSAISGGLNSLNAGAAYAARQAAFAAIETGIEIVIGKLISAAIGVPFEPDTDELGRSFGTNFVSNLVTSKITKMNKIRNLLDFAIRTVSDVWIGGQNLWWSSAINLMSIGGSALLAKYGEDIFGVCLRKWGGCFVAGTPIVVGFEHSTEELVSSDQGSTLLATDRRTITRAIETVELGSRVITEAPDHLPSESEFGEPDQATWKQISLLQHRGDGTEIEMTLLRPQWWIDSLGLQIGRVFELQFTELQTAGYAKVLDICVCPPIEQDGKGKVVIGRFVTREATNLLQATLDNGTEFTGTTNHLVWSVDDSDWRPLEDFAVGDLVNTLSGESRIEQMEPVSSAKDVFNLEVDGDHVYRIVGDGVLVHNANYAPISLDKLRPKIAKIPGFDAHHVIPHELTNASGLKTLFQKAAKKGWDVNGLRNGINLDGAIRHVNRHQKYTAYIEERLLKHIQRRGGIANVTDLEARRYLEGVGDSMKQFLNKTSGNIDELFEWVG